MRRSRQSLARNLILAFLLVALTVAVLVALIIRLTSPGELGSLIVDQQRSDYKTLLVDYYQTHDSWDGVWIYIIAQSRRNTFTQAAPQQGGAAGSDSTPLLAPLPNQQPDRRALFGVVDTQGVVVVPLLPVYPAGAHISTDTITLSQGEAIEVDGKMVGTILTAPSPPGLTPQETAYLQRTNLALLLAGAGAVVVALLVGVLLARTLTRPLQALTQAAQRMSRGELEQQVVVRYDDEIGQLASAFNQMSREIVRSNEARRQMTADVTHELRTPLTVIAGYVESMRDGTLAPTAERLAVVYAEVNHLQHLVGDLRTLALADTGELKLDKHPVMPQELLQQAYATFEHQATRQGVQLELKLAPDLPTITVDEVRMTQVLDNLISNALRFTPAGGKITLQAAPDGKQAPGPVSGQVAGLVTEKAADQVTLTVQDTGKGISPEDLPSVFNRFYRADKARASKNGEVGLGLAIVKAIVEAHAGTIEATSTPGKGTTFLIHLPIFI